MTKMWETMSPDQIDELSDLINGGSENVKTNSCLNTQVGGNHYKTMRIQPIEIAKANKLCFRTFSALKYIMRYNKPGGDGSMDIRKAIHYLQILLEQEYQQQTRFEVINDADDEIDSEIKDNIDDAS